MSASGQRGALARWLAPVLLLLLCLPFLGRAHGIDDPLYLQAAQRVLEAPGAPLGGPSFWHDRPTTLFHDLYNPPLTAYLLALPVAVDGGSEVAVHLLMLALACLALLACAWAGEGLGVDPRWALLLASSPALATGALSAMTDVPFLLLCALAWGTAVRGQTIAAGGWAGLSALTKYAGLLNLPIIGVGARPRGWRAALGPLAALLVFAAYCLWVFRQHGALHIEQAGRLQRFALEHQARLLLAFVAALGIAGLPAALALLRWTALQMTVAILAGLAGFGLVHAETWSMTAALLGFVSVGAGAALLWCAAAASLGTSAGPLPSAAFWAFAAQAALLVHFGATRYALPTLPPLVWLLVRGGRLQAQPSRRRFGLALGAACLLTLLVLWADSGYANAWRTAAGRLPGVERGFSVGHWGFQWYAEARGYRPLDPREELRSGDVVAEGRGIHRQPISPAHAALLSRASLVRVPSPAMRVMDRTAGAGFYSDFWGPLPFSTRLDASEEVAIRSVASWIPTLLDEPLEGGVAVDLGARETSFVCLDGWSGDESFEAGGLKRTFAWAVGSESALRLLLPRGVRLLRLVASASDAAVGPLRISIGSSASAVVNVRPGWRSYTAVVSGEVSGGVTTVVLRPAGHGRPGPFDAERRALSVAVDAIGFGEADLAASRGVWPARTRADEPGLLVAGTTRLLTAGGAARLRGRLLALAGSAEITAGSLAWSSRDAGCESSAGCAFDLSLPADAAAAVLRADAAILSDLSVDRTLDTETVPGSTRP